jgi:hypothetical protein
VLQAIGASLKRGPLQARLTHQGGVRPAGCVSTWLLLFNYILSLLILITIVALVPASTMRSRGQRWRPWSLPSSRPISSTAQLTVVKHGALPSRLEAPPVEWVADFCLLTYVVVNTLFFNLVTSHKERRPPVSATS